MQKRFTCAAGHSWEVSVDGGFDVSGIACPVCGATAQTAAGTTPQPAATLPAANSPVEARPLNDEPIRPEPPAVGTLSRDVVGQYVGPYKLLQKIGEGGMGTVYMAEQQQPVRRRVALKIVKPGMDSEQIIARFESERQALALMDHQNIARVLDAGTTETGRPYFVMELIKGVPITKYCDDNRLSPRERLELFVPVCHAIQHAHQKGIIHRDIKPSNVLVTMYDGRPVPKIIDFGVAKALDQRLTEKTMFTHFGQVIGTLEYMSPEQAEINALDIDTRSDVYSLGVVLYELLTGSTPLDEHRLGAVALDELLRAIREVEPLPPSTRLSKSGELLATVSAQRRTEPARLARLMRGELDWIVMKALEKDRTRRYDSANAFARDVQRFLCDEAVEACPPSTLYQLTKFARKHRHSLTVALLFALLLLTGTGFSTYFAVLARHEATRAKQAADHASAKTREAIASATAERAQRSLARRHLYAAHMHLVREAWDRLFGYSRVLELLQQQEPPSGQEDLRGFEWHYWNDLAHAYRLNLTGHEDEVTGVVLSSDGRWLASAGLDSVRLWDAGSGRLLKTLRNHSGATAGVAFRPDSRRLATASEDGTAHVWDPATGEESSVLRGHSGPVLGVAFNGDGTRIATVGEDGTVRLWDAANGQELRSLPGTSDVAFSPYPVGERVLAGSEDEVKVWDAATGKLLQTLAGSGGGVTCVACNMLLWAAGFDDGTVKVWDASNGVEISTYSIGDLGVRDVAISPDGMQLATACDDHTVSIWSIALEKKLFVLKGHTASVSGVAFSSDGKWLVSSSADQTIKVWDATREPGASRWIHNPHILFPDNRTISSPDGKLRATFRRFPIANILDTANGRPLRTFEGLDGTFSPDGKWLAFVRNEGSGGLQPIRIVDTISGKEQIILSGHLGYVGPVAFRTDGKQLATAGHDQTIRIWDVESGQQLLTVPTPGGPVTCVALSPDGKLLAAAGGGVALQGALSTKHLNILMAKLPPEVERMIMVWDVASGRQLHEWKGHTAHVVQLAFDPVGKRLASASYDQTVKIWDPAVGEEVVACQGHTAAVRRITFSDEGDRLISLGEDHTVRTWDARNGQELHKLHEKDLSVERAVLSPGGKWLAALSDAPEDVEQQDDQPIVALWDLRSGKKTATWKESKSAQSLSWLSADGTQLASLELEPALRVVDAASQRELHALRAHAEGIVWFLFSPDGQYLATASPDGELKIWDAASGTLRSAYTLDAAPVCQTSGLSNFGSAAFSADGTHFVVLGSLRGPSTVTLGSPSSPVIDVCIADISTGRWQVLKGDFGDTRAVALSADEKRLALGDSDGTLHVRDASNGNLLRTLRSESASVHCVAFSPDGKRIVSGDRVGIVRLWDTITGEALPSFSRIDGLTGAPFIPMMLAFSADSQHLWSAGQ